MEAVRLPGLRGRPRTRPKHLAGDKAYSYRPVFAYLRRRRIRPVIPPRKGGNMGKGCPRTFDPELYRKRNAIEIVLTQMTKTPARTVGAERDSIADLHLVVGDHDAVDQQFHELSALGEVGLGQPALHPLAELGR
jgi:hypothetical protein